MNWKPFPFPEPAFVYDAASLRQHWARLHQGDLEVFPVKAPLVEAWIAFHAGDFHRAMKLGLAQGVCGYSVAHKATCVYASDIETDEASKLALFDVVAERCERHQREAPGDPAAWYWQAFALGRYAQTISVVKALAKGLAPKIRHGFRQTVTLAPEHADGWIGLGVYQSEIVGAAGPLIASMTYGARKEDCHADFRRAIELNPHSPSAYMEYANAQLRFDGKRYLDDARTLYRQAAALQPLDAKERLEVERARRKLEIAA
jgi:tetratricopeptide (TPR) repeat protein